MRMRLYLSTTITEGMLEDLKSRNLPIRRYKDYLTWDARMSFVGTNLLTWINRHNLVLVKQDGVDYVRPANPPILKVYTNTSYSKTKAIGNYERG